jgi:hypothetical protein
MLVHNIGKNRVKRQPMKWEKIFANYTSERSCYPEYIRSSKKSITLKQN